MRLLRRLWNKLLGPRYVSTHHLHRGYLDPDCPECEAMERWFGPS